MSLKFRNLTPFVVAAIIFACGVLVVSQRLCLKNFSVAFVGFFDSDALVFEDAGRATNVRVETFSRDEFFSLKNRSKRFDAVVFRTIGFKAENETPEIRARLDACAVVVPYPTQNELFERFAKMPATLAPEALDARLATPTPLNARSLLLLLRREITGEEIEVPAPEELPTSGFFYRGTEVSPTFDAWLQRSDVPSLPADAPRAAFVGSFLNPFKTADSAPLIALVEALARRGIRAVPIFGFRNAPEKLEEVRPDLVVAFPLGRLLPNDEASELFKRLDAPVLTAINLSVSRSQWLAEPVGATATYQNLAIALPELDGATEPTPISTLEPDAEGRELRAPIADRVERLADRAARWIALRRKSNGEKKVAIFYRRSPGAAAITAQSLDAVPSLFNALNAMRASGYDLGDDFPESLESFAEILDRRGRTVGQWAPGAFRKFLDDADPERVATSDYLAWAEKDLSENARRETSSVWGEAPGVCFSGKTENDDSFIVVSRVLFGNVAILPQPTTEIIADEPDASDFDSVHGTNKAPPHFYQAAYLWVREGFQADAIAHFGTHGSLEFARGKSALLSEDDWPDALIGNLPNIYLYSINNVGEALLAKRRIRAALVSHSTPPFVAAGASDETLELERLLDDFDATEDENIRRGLAQEIEQTAQDADLTRYEPTPDERSKNDEQRCDFYRKQIQRLRETNVSDGLHVVGRLWTETQIQRTAEAIGTTDAKERLRESTGGIELTRFVDALSGRFIPPSTGGDPIVNPDSIPTGRNVAGVNIERTPDASTFRVAQKLTDELIEDFRLRNGRDPRRIALTLWGGEYLRTRGLTVAQALWALGVRPKFDGKGVLRDFEVVPSEELGRPRIDVVVQTSGQFRDAAFSRIELLDRAVRAVSALPDESFPNYVREHSRNVAKSLISQGFVESEANELSTARIFGSTRALDYGTGIRRLIERSDRWETRGEIAERYLLNMGGIYRSAEVWGVPVKGLLEANLTDTDVVLQSRSSNVWGPVKLDHLYEFGTLAMVVKEKTGVDPKFLLSDARRSSAIRAQSLDEAIRDELQTTFWNRRWLEGAIREKGGGGAAALAKATQNLFGWSVVGKEGLIDDGVWRRTFDIIVEDRFKLGTKQYFEETNPAALTETTAVMLDAVRKGFWDAPQEVAQKLATTHWETIRKFGASCSYNVCGNKDLREFIAARLPEREASAYREALDEVVRDAATDANVEGVELVETSTNEEKSTEVPNAESVGTLNRNPTDAHAKTLVVFVAILLTAFGFAAGRRR